MIALGYIHSACEFRPAEPHVATSSQDCTYPAGFQWKNSTSSRYRCSSKRLRTVPGLTLCVAFELWLFSPRVIKTRIDSHTVSDPAPHDPASSPHPNFLSAPASGDVDTNEMLIVSCGGSGHDAHLLVLLLIVQYS